MASLVPAERAAQARPARLVPALALSRSAARTCNRWVDRLASSPPWLASLGARLGQALRQPVALSAGLPRLAAEPPADETRLLLPLEVQPGGPNLVLDLDSDLAAAAVDALLAGPGEPPTVLRPLSELERGALSYLVLLACRELQQRTGQRICLRSLGSERPALPPRPHLVLPVQVGLGQASGEVRVRVPLEPDAAELPRPASLTSSLAGSVLGASVEVRAIAGQGVLPWREIRLLSPGDLLFLDRITIDREGRGQAVLVCGRAGQALPCRCEPGPAGPRRLALLGAAAAQPPLLEREDQAMADNRDFIDSTVADTVADAPAAAMLDDVPVHLCLELGRVQLSARELLSLRVGHVIELDRTHNDPLDISINGQTIASGELVEVEGRLGVRISRLVSR